MSAIRLQIGDALVAKLAAIPGAVARYLQDETGDENTSWDGGLLCAVVLGTDQQTGETNRPITRELSGHVIVESEAESVTEEGWPVMDAAAREAWHEKVSTVEAAILELTDEITVPGVIHFRLTSTDLTFDGVPSGRLAARLDWLCSYRHQATDPRLAG